MKFFAKMAVQVEELAKLKAHRWQVSSLEFRPDGRWLASAGWDKEVHIRDLNNMQVYCTLKGVHKVPITNLSWQRPAGKLLCTCSADHTVALWDVEMGEHVRTLTGHDDWVLGSSFSVSGSGLATASWDGSISIWDTRTGEQVNSYTEHTKGVWAVDFHPHSSNILVSASEDSTVRIWDMRQGKVTRTLDSGHTDAVYCVKWSPDGTMIASGSADTKVKAEGTYKTSDKGDIKGHPLNEGLFPGSQILMLTILHFCPPKIGNLSMKDDFYYFCSFPCRFVYGMLTVVC